MKAGEILTVAINMGGKRRMFTNYHYKSLD